METTFLYDNDDSKTDSQNTMSWKCMNCSGKIT